MGQALLLRLAITISLRCSFTQRKALMRACSYCVISVIGWGSPTALSRLPYQANRQKMTETTEKQALIARLNSETAKISWLELQKHYASGTVLGVAPGADIIKVAIALSEDNAPQIQAWLSDKSVFEVADQQAMKWYENQTILWALVIPPFVLVQEPST